VNDPLLYSGVRFYPIELRPERQGRQAATDRGSEQRFWREADHRAGGERYRSTRRQYHGAFRRIHSRLRCSRRAGLPQIERAGKSGSAPDRNFEKSTGQDFDVWFPPMDGVADNSKAPYLFQATDLKMGQLHGINRFRTNRTVGRLSGVVLLGVGLAFVFYVVHMRFLGGASLRSKDGPMRALDRRNCESQPGRVRAALQRSRGRSGSGTETNFPRPLRANQSRPPLKIR